MRDLDRERAFRQRHRVRQVPARRADRLHIGVTRFAEDAVGETNDHARTTDGDV